MTGALPPRVERLRQEIGAAIPCCPNTPDVRAELEHLPLPSLLFAFYNWAGRFIPQRPRRLDFVDGFWDRRAMDHKRAIFDLAGAIRRGEDLSPHLSDKVRTHGYVPRPQGRKRGPEWGDKDFALNGWDVHHLHLRPDGSSELLYVVFGRDHAAAIMLGDHKSFDDGTLEEQVVKARAASGHMVVKGTLGLGSTRPAQERVGAARRGGASMAEVDGKVVLSAMIASDGSSDRHFDLARRALRTMQECDPKLDDPQWLAALATPPIEFVEPFWCFSGTDLCLASRSGHGVRIVDGRC